MRKRAILVHGFNVSDGGAGTTDTLRAGLEAKGFEVVEFDTKWRRGLLRDLISVRMDNGKRARRLASMLQSGDILIGHSNGCAIIDMACWYLASICSGAPKVGCLYLNPALDVDTPLAPQVAACWVMHSPTDKTVKKAALLFKSRWGAMGAYGYQVEKGYLPDARYVNIPYEHHGVCNVEHSGAFKTEAGRRAIIFRAATLGDFVNTCDT